ncbi:hypothetical protein GCM10010439_55430 [Actinocorallia aurantiaca]|uniref:Uncharacterized protein n=2 Tax=Actinocorallia aurantiaca TaxID=46204 RepID=A0ABN3UKI9_9ACTN
MGVVKDADPANPTIGVFVPPGCDVAMPRRLLDRVGLVYAVEPLRVGEPIDVSALERYTALLIVLQEPQQAELLADFVRLARPTKIPVTLLAGRRELGAGLPPVLDELTVVFADGEAQAIADRLRGTMLFFHETRAKWLVRQRRSHEKAVSQSSTAELKVRDTTILNSAPEAQQVPDQIGELVTVAREDIGSFLETQLGARALPSERGEQWGVAVWVDALSSPAFNPVLVHYGQAPADGTELEGQLKERDLHLGVLVVDEADTTWHIDESVAWVAIGVARLAQMNKAQFGRLLVQGRNRLVHG